jgi:hypothetical protein
MVGAFASLSIESSYTSSLTHALLVKPNTAWEERADEEQNEKEREESLLFWITLSLSLSSDHHPPNNRRVTRTWVTHGFTLKQARSMRAKMMVSSRRKSWFLSSARESPCSSSAPSLSVRLRPEAAARRGDVGESNALVCVAIVAGSVVWSVVWSWEAWSQALTEG